MLKRRFASESTSKYGNKSNKVSPLFLPSHPAQAFSRGIIASGNKQGVYQHSTGDSGLVQQRILTLFFKNLSLPYRKIEFLGPDIMAREGLGCSSHTR